VLCQTLVYEISNISGLPPDLIESIKLRFKTGRPLVGADEQFTIERSLPHGNVTATSNY